MLIAIEFSSECCRSSITKFSAMFYVLIPLIVSLTLADNNYGEQYRNCDYAQRMVPNRQYYVYNRGYPQNYLPGTSCRWVLTSDNPIKISCDVFDIPVSPKCTQDALIVQEFGNVAGHSYCGKGNFTTVVTSNNITIILKSASNSTGGKFLCTVQSQSTGEENSKCRCGWKNPSRIVDGVETGVNEYPMMAGLIDIRKSSLLCGATIINEKQVLTAAHCIPINIATIAVLVGDHDLTDGIDTNATMLYQVDATQTHPAYDTLTWDNDIGLVTIRGTIIFSQLVGPACLPFQHSPDTFGGNFVEILGWGSTAFAEGPSNTLQKATVSIMTNVLCKRTYPGLTERQICTYDHNKDSCQFDSGGPVLWQNPSTRRLVEIGIISLGTSCGYGDPSQNTRVGAFIKWIVSNTPSVILISLIFSLTLVDNSYGQQYHNCDYAGLMIPNKKYYIYNQEYPQNYGPGTSCRWVLTSDNPIQITCAEFDIPFSTDCTQDVLIIEEFGTTTVHRNCLKGKFTMVSSTKNITIVLNTATDSRGGRFSCTALSTTINEENSKCNCGQRNPKRIVRGKETGVNEFPMMAGLFDAPKKSLLCGATIINKKQVLTAAHCLITANMTVLFVLVGDHDLSTGEETTRAKIYPVESIQMHPAYNVSWDNDIALVTIRNEIEFDTFVGPVCLPIKHSLDTFDGNSVEVLGWGSTAFGEGPSNTLQKADVKVITNARCNQTFPGISNRQICVYDEERDSCQFDSGGPVLWENPKTHRLVEIGIITLGSSCGTGDPSQNTRVSEYISWIIANTPPDIQYCQIE